MEFKIYEDFEPELQQLWQKFYAETGATYSLSFEWCKTWFSHFGQDRKLFIITGWEGETLRLIAPFYKNRDKSNRLILLGTDPDFLDEFDILRSNDSCLLKLVDFMFEHSLELDIKFIHSEHPLFIYLTRRNEQEKLYSLKAQPYTLKLLICKTGDFETNLKNKYKKIKRKENIAKKEYNDEIAYEFDPPKSEQAFEEFLDFHRQKWDALKAQDKSDFLKDLYLNNDFVILSRMFLKNSNITLAHDFKFTASNNILYHNICGFNQDYSVLSPGICVVCYDLMSDIFKNSNYIDFGNGVHEYKYWFANKEKIIFNLQLNQSWKRFKKIYYPLKFLKQKISAVF